MTHTEFDLDRINALTGTARISAITDLVNREEDKLKVAAQKAHGADPEAFKRLPSQKKEYKRSLIADLKENKRTGGAELGELGSLEEIIDMNILHNGSLISAANLTNNILSGKINIQNPNESIIETETFKDALSSTGKLGNNLKRIQSILQEGAIETKNIDLASKIDVNKFLGAVDASKGKTREEVYEYWGTIANKFEQVNSTANTFIKAVDDSSLPDELKKKFVSLFNIREFGRLQYIVDFPLVEEELLNHRHRFFNLISSMITAERLLDNLSVSGKTNKEKEEYGDTNAELTAEFLEGIKNSDLGAATVNMWTGSAEINDPKIAEAMTEGGVDWEGDIDPLMQAADPLLMYEHKLNRKLVAVTNEAYVDFQEVLEEAIDKIEDGEFKVSLDFKTNLEQWADELEDTMVLDQTNNFYLPISVLANNDFNSLYTEEDFDGTVIDEPLSLETLDDIKDFFTGLYELITEDLVTTVTAARTSKGKGRGTDTKLTFRSVDSKRNRLKGAVQRQYRKTLPSHGKLSELFGDELKGALQDFMEQCLEYYFEPAYTGRMPIQTPNFVGSIGGRVIQILSADLGLETVMSGAYQKMTDLANPFKERDLENIADFLQNIFLKSMDINTYLIAQGERAAKSMTNIFKQKENNNNYFAALLYHFMEKTGDFSRATSDFNGASLKERNTKFNEGYKNRTAYPIFAMPFWLDLNQGVITQKNQKSKDQYNRLKNIFETVQPNLSVLLHKMLDAHDVVRGELGKPVVYGFFPLNQIGYDGIINKMYQDEQIDLSNYEVDTIIKTIDSHENISKDYGISPEQVYLIKAHFR